MSQVTKITTTRHDQCVEILSRFMIFEDFKGHPEILTEFHKIMKPKNFSPGTLIIKEGETGSEMYLLLAGKVGVFKKTPSGDEYKVADLSDKMNIVFGEGAIIDVDTRSATIKALTEVECYEINSVDFESFSKNHPEWALPVFRRIARAIMGRLRKTNQDFMLVYNALVAEIKGG